MTAKLPLRLARLLLDDMIAYGTPLQMPFGWSSPDSLDVVQNLGDCYAYWTGPTTVAEVIAECKERGVTFELHDFAALHKALSPGETFSNYEFGHRAIVYFKVSTNWAHLTELERELYRLGMPFLNMTYPGRCSELHNWMCNLMRYLAAEHFCSTSELELDERYDFEDDVFEELLELLEGRANVPWAYFFSPDEDASLRPPMAEKATLAWVEEELDDKSDDYREVYAYALDEVRKFYAEGALELRDVDGTPEEVRAWLQGHA